MMAKKENSLPNGWKLTTLGNIAKWGSGGTPKSTEKKYYGGTIPWLIIGDLNDSYVYQSRTHITNEGLKNSSAKIIQPNSVLLAMYGSIGKLGINKIPLATNQAIAFTEKLNDDVYYLYLFYYLLSIRSKLHSLGKGGTQKNISQTVLKPVTIPLPPFEIQQQIVKKIETLFSELDNSVANLKAAKAQLKRYRQSVLKSAFEGNLTAAWREANADKLETAETLMDRIKVEREGAYASKSRKPKEISPLTDDEVSELSELPNGWGWVKVGEAFSISGGLTKNATREKMVQQVPFLRVANVYSNELKLDDIHTIGISDTEMERVLLQKNDILIVEGNGSGDQIGRMAIWNGSIKGMVHQNHLIKARPSLFVNPKYCLYFFQSMAGRELITRVATSTSGLFTLNLFKVENLLLPIVGTAEQHQIVNEIESRLSEADVMERTINESLIKAEKMRQSILKKAFEGKLC